MCAICRHKAEEIAALAQFLRKNAPTVRSNYYSTIMNAAAADLEEMALYYTERCRCRCRSRHREEMRAAPAVAVAAADQAAASPSALAPPPPLATPTIAGRSKRSCST
jgi:hypothetical protein